jgi:hypothetical protein
MVPGGDEPDLQPRGSSQRYELFHLVELRLSADVDVAPVDERWSSRCRGDFL